jgi:hypothetical protein
MTIGLGDEVAWWCPSLDTSGNGTATLNDLAGSNDGTLTDMDAATDWVADTANDGIRALDFDGSNDRVVVTDNVLPVNTAECTICYWMRRPTSSTFGPFFGLGLNTGVITNRFEFEPYNDNLLYVSFSISDYASIALDQDWHHYAAVYDGSQTGNANRLKVYKDGVAQTVTFTGEVPASIGASALKMRMGNGQFGTFGAGRVDDARVYDRAITASEVEHLATGRGVLGDGTSSGGIVDVTLDNWTLTATGESSVSGSLDSEVAWSLSALGVAHDYGQLSSTLADWTLSATADVPIQSGAVEVTLDDWTLESTAVASNTGSLDVTLSDWTLAAVGVSSVEAQLNATVSWSLTAAAQFGDGYSAALDATLDDWTLSATAIHKVAGGLSVVLDDWTVQATAQVRSRKPRRLFASQLHASSMFGA